MTTKSLAGLGPPMQMAFVPRDFDAALAWWTGRMGVGPFFALEHVPFENTRYYGAATAPDISVYLAYWGEQQVELVRQHNDAPSIYKSWLDEGCEGLHHTCVIVDDVTPGRRLVESAGMRIALEAGVPGGGYVVYVDAGGGPGSLVEVLQPAPGTLEAFQMFKKAAQGWDGSNPVRRLR